MNKFVVFLAGMATGAILMSAWNWNVKRLNKAARDSMNISESDVPPIEPDPKK